MEFQIKTENVTIHPDCKLESIGALDFRSLIDKNSDVEKSECLQNKKNKFVCDICHKELAYKQSLTVHRRIHTGEKPFVCEVCQKGFNDKSKLMKHLRNHTGDKPYVCDICKEGFKDKKHLYSHKILVHIGKKPFSCDLCGTSFLTARNMKKHLEVVHDGAKPYKCKVCSKAFQNKTVLDRHMPTHTRERPFICNICDKSFKFKSGYDAHLKTNKIVEKDGIKTHERVATPRTFKCEVCDKALTRKIAVTLHMRIHTGENPYFCEICKESFMFAAGLRRHIRERHSGSPDFTCNVCDSKYYSKRQLNHHIRSEHRPSDRRKIFNCTLCQKRFPKVNLLKKHMLFHSKRKYECFMCRKIFYSQSDLISHRYTYHVKKPSSGIIAQSWVPLRKSNNDPHWQRSLSISEPLCLAGTADMVAMPLEHSVKNSTLKEYKFHEDCCNICDKKFMSRSELQEHMNTHNILDKDNSITMVVGSKSYACNICSEAFSSKYLLIQHKMTHVCNEAFKCEICNQKFMSKSLLETHLFSHNGEKSFVCKLCNKAFFTRSLLDRHLITHSHKDSKVCETEDKKKETLHHPKVNGSEEPIAIKGISTVQQPHEAEGTKFFSIECKICKKTFTKKSAYSSHVSKHRKKPYVCNICNIYIKSDQGYHNHMRSHIDLPPPQVLAFLKNTFCKICNRSFSNILSFQSHQLLHKTFNYLNDFNTIIPDTVNTSISIPQNQPQSHI